MPLLDHCRPPLSRTHPWRTFHGAWAAAMARLLNAGVLPEGYYALPHIIRDEVQDEEDVRVEVLAEKEMRRVAVIELVSPRKEQPRAREAFAAHSVGHLQHGRNVVVVDAVTTGLTDVNAAILATLAPQGREVVTPPAGMLAASYRARRSETESQLQVWWASLKVDEVLPTVPLWLSGEIAVPLDLEASHSATCVDLRIRQAG